jgi:predicted amidohydrolase
MLKIGITRLDIKMGDKEENKKRCLDIIREAANENVELLVFPEMTLTGFIMQPWDIEEHYEKGKIPDTISFFMKQSRKYNMAIVFGYVESFVTDSGSEFFPEGEKKYENKLALVDGDNLIMDYAKIHPFSYSGENRVYEPGNKICQSKIKDIRIGGYICYDLRFPEIFSAARNEYDGAVVIANWPKQRINQWKILLAARAIENQSYVIGVNRTGIGDDIEYEASSYVFDCYGNEISTTISDRLSVAVLDSGFIKEAREKFPQKADRRNFLYKNLL